MQPEGPNKSEERLQRYAKERRQGADFSLHPATRRLLQGEVARQFGARAKAERAGLSWLGWWRGRFAFGGALAAVLITAGWFYFNGGVQKRARMELADAKLSQTEKGIALESDRFAFGAEVEKSVVATAPPALRDERVNKPAPARSRALDGIVANDLQLGAKLETDNLVVMSDTRESNEVVHYFADFASVLPMTNAVVTAYSIAPVTDLWNYQSLTPTSQTSLAEKADAGVVANWGANRGFGGAAGATDSVLFAENAPRFNMLNTPLPQVALRNESEEAKRVQELSDLTKTQPQIAYKNVAEPLALAPQNITAPAAPAQRPADASGLSESLAAVQSVGQKGIESRSAVGNRGAGLSRSDVNNSQTFFRQSFVPAEETPSAAKQLEAAVAKKSEDTVASQVLSQFTVEQQGNSVRLMDFDGSVYNGVIDAPAAAEAGKLKEDVGRDKDGTALNRALNEQQVRQSGDASQSGEYSFRASGSNVALRQFIVVNARFRHGTNASLGVGQRGFGTAGNVTLPREDAAAPAPTGPPATRRTVDRFGRAGATDSPVAIEGTVQIGTTNVQRFLAVPGTRQ